MGGEEINQKLVTLSHNQAQQERIINELIASMVDFEFESFETLLNAEIASKGIERIINDIVFPFLEKIGVLWVTNHINPAQEHLVTNIIRQKLLVGIDAIKYPAVDGKSALLFLPEGQFHELGLLYVFFLLKNRGVKVYYLGADVPLVDLGFIVEAKKPDYLYTHLTALAHNFNVDKFFTNLHNRIPTVPVLISGPISHSYNKPLPPNFQFKKSLQEVKDFIS
jgi:methanogenic corrinoid protein MtbC1